MNPAYAFEGLKPFFAPLKQTSVQGYQMTRPPTRRLPCNFQLRRNQGQVLSSSRLSHCALSEVYRWKDGYAPDEKKRIPADGVGRLLLGVLKRRLRYERLRVGAEVTGSPPAAAKFCPTPSVAQRGTGCRPQPRLLPRVQCPLAFASI